MEAATPIPSRPSNILIVDDQAANLQVLSEILRARGHKVRPVPSGKFALSAAEKDPPDLVLLDIMMPEMNGYEVCRCLKENPLLRHIPVIFISALDDTADRVTGFTVGGVDYIAKPFRADEVLARVEAHLNLHYYQDALEEKTRQLEVNYATLKELEDLRDQLTHMIVHDMRNLLTAVAASLKLLEADLTGKLEERTARYLQSATRCTNDLTELINNVLDVSKMEAERMTLCIGDWSMVALVGEALEKLEGTREGREITFSYPQQDLMVRADRDIMLRVVINLLNNAIKFTACDGLIAIKAEPMGDAVLFSVSDNGPGIPFEYREKIFAKFGQVETTESRKQRRSTGLGLTFCKLAIEAHGGRIWVESTVSVGATFYFRIPGRIDRSCEA